MNTAKPIARPRKGKAEGHWVKRAATGKARSVKVGDTRNGDNQLLVIRVTGVRTGNRANMLASIKKGLKFTVITELEKAFEASQKEIAQLLSIPASTLTRRKNEGRLHTDESDRVVRFASLKDAALTLMQGDNDAAINWLRAPLEILGGESPLEHASTELGARDVEDLIGRLRHGVFS